MIIVFRNVLEFAFVVDKSFILLFQGNEEEELPEVIMGCCTALRVDTTTAKKL